MSPTQLGVAIADELGIETVTARRVNEVLITAGLQIAERTTNARGKKKLQYKLTELGEPYGRLQLETAKGHSKTVYIVRWFSSVIPLIIDEFKE